MTRLYSRLSAVWLILTLLTSCHCQPLVVETVTVSERTLASRYVGTPDPRRYCPTVGQALIVLWRLPREQLCRDNPHLVLTVRFGNREQEEISIPVSHFRGSYAYWLVDDDYWDRCGVLTYKVEFFAGGEILECWHHQVWTEMITLDIPDETECDACTVTW